MYEENKGEKEKKPTKRNEEQTKNNFHWRAHHAHGMHYENKHKCQLTTLIIKQ